MPSFLHIKKVNVIIIVNCVNVCMYAHTVSKANRTKYMYTYTSGKYSHNTRDSSRVVENFVWFVFTFQLD